MGFYDELKPNEVPMTISELSAEIEKLPYGERILLLETIVKSLRQEPLKPKPSKEPLNLFGILKTDELPPSDDDLNVAHFDRLSAKHR